MKELLIEIPSDLSEVSLGKYQQLQKFIENEKDEEKVSIELVSIFCNLTHEEVRALPKSEYDEISNHLIKILNKDCHWKQRFTLDGVEYAFLPNLDEITFGEYVDLDTYIKNTDDLNKVMTVLYRPIEHEHKGRYTVVKYTGNEDTDIMLNAPMDAVKGTLVFFYHLGNELLNHMPVYFNQQVEKTTQSNKTLVVDGDGIQVYSDLLTESLHSLMKLQKETCMSV